MTNEEAIRFGNCILMVADDKSDNTTIEFTKLAIKALEQGDVLREIRQEIECNMESITGKYDESTPTRDLPSYKIERNEGRKECIKLIDSKIKELSE